MSEANRTGLYIKKQVDKNSPVQPSTELDHFRYTSSSLSSEPTTVSSVEVRQDRKRSDLIKTDVENSGSIDYELSFGSFSEMYSGALFGDWSRKASASVSDVTSISSGSIDFDKDVGLFSGALIKITSNDEDLNGVYEVSAWDSSTYTATATGIPAKSTLPTKVDVKLVGQVYDSTDVAVSQSNKTITLGSGASDALDVTLLAGECIILNTGVGATSGFFRIKSSASNVYTYDREGRMNSLSSVPSGKAYVLFGDVLRDGVQKNYYTIVTDFAGSTGKNKQVVSGAVFDTMSLSMEVGQILTGAFGILGLNSEYNDNTYTYAEASTYTPFNATSNVGTVLVGNVEITGPNYIQSASINVNNNGRQQKAVGTEGSVDIAGGTSEISGNLETYFGDSSIAEDVLNNVEKSFMFSLEDSNQNVAMIFDLPRIKYSSGSPSVEGVDTDNTIAVEFQALLDTSMACQMSCQEFHYK